MRMAQDAVGNTAKQGIDGVGFAVAAHEDDVRLPFFRMTQNQRLWSSIIDDEFELASVLPVISETRVETVLAN